MWKLVRIWILFSWSFLTIGILLGSWWAYHELGWGGWWFWDPVENASLMPWLLATACIHSITKKRLNYWTLISTQGTFIMSILGTFFVRSGLLSSVHSFATDSTRAQALFLFLLCITSVSVLNWISLCLTNVEPPSAALPRKVREQLPPKGYRRAAIVPAGSCFRPPLPIQVEMKRSVEQILLLQNFYLSLICIVVFCGTSAPLIFHWLFNRNVGTGAPFYNATTVPLFTSLFLVLVYAHYIQFNPSRSERALSISGACSYRIQRLVFFKLLSEFWGILTVNGRSFCRSYLSLFVPKNAIAPFNYKNYCFASIRIYYFLFFFFINILIGSSPLVGLNLLDSIYGAICILLISSIIAPTKSQTVNGSCVKDVSCFASILNTPTTYRSRERPTMCNVTSFLFPGLRQISRKQHNRFPVLYPSALVLRENINGPSAPLPRRASPISLRPYGAFPDDREPVLGYSNLSGNAGYTRMETLAAHRNNFWSSLSGPESIWLPGMSSRHIVFHSNFGIQLACKQHIFHEKQHRPKPSPERLPRPTGGTDRRIGYRLGPYQERFGSVMKKCIVRGIHIIANTYRFYTGLTTINRFLGSREPNQTLLELYPARKSLRRRFVTFVAGYQLPKRAYQWDPNGRTVYGFPPQMNIAHTGIVLFIFGIILSNTFKFELTERLQDGPLGVRLGSQVCCLRSIDHSFAPTYHSICANLLVYQQVNINSLIRGSGTDIWFTRSLQLDLKPIKEPVPSPSLYKVVSYGNSLSYSNKYSDAIVKVVRLDGQFMSSICMFPEKRFYYSNQGAVATKVAIHSNLFTDFYSLIGTGSFETGWFTTIMKLPFIFCIWLGFLFGVIGGTLALKAQLKKSKVFWT